MKIRFLIFLFLSINALAQNQIIGTVVDAKTNELLQFANVYISNTAKGTQTDAAGKFTLLNVPLGKIQLAATYLGYEGFQQTVSIPDGKQVTLVIRMMPSANVLNEVEIKAKKRDKAWERDLRLFKQQFLGESTNAGQCKILNEWAIELEQSELDKTIRAKASRPIEIENRALGYKIFYDLKQFSLGQTQFKLSGNTRFENLLPTDAKEAKKWEENRKETYKLSSRYFFKSLMNGQLEQDGFVVYQMRTKADWSAPIKEYRNGSNQITDSRSGTILAEMNGVDKLLFLEQPIDVTNNSKYVRMNGQSQNPITFIRALKPRVELSRDGWLQDPTAVEMAGYWATERIAEMLPREYGSEVQENSIVQTAIPLVYLHLNRSGFVAGEKIWFSSYILNRESKGLVAAQQPLYIQLYSPDGVIVAEEKIFTSNGRGFGNMQIENKLFSGVYRLRAFTKPMLNAPESIFEKEIVVQNIQEKIQIVRKEHPVGANTKEALKIEITPTSAPTPRGKVELKIKVKTANQEPVQGVFSMAVTDDRKGIKTTDDFTIVEYTSQESKPKSIGNNFKPEVAMHLTGTVQLAKSKKPLPFAQVVFMVVDSTQKKVSRVVNANENGYFEITDLELMGNANVVYQVNNKRGKPEYDGAVVLDGLNPNEKIPAIKFDKIQMPDEKRTELVMGIQKIDGDEFVVPMGDLLLEELVVKDQKAPKDVNDVGVIKLYSEPTHSVSFNEKAPRFADIYDMLAGTLPGVQMGVDANGIKFVFVRGVGSLNPVSPLFVVDGTPIEGEITSIVNPNDVFKIDLLSDGMAGGSYGIRAAGGVILIYTRRFRGQYNNLVYAKTLLLKGLQEDQSYYTPDYSKPKPDHRDPDRRTTIYWNPEIITNQNGEATVSFYAADATTTYKIVVEGLTQGIVGRGEKKIEVK